MPYGRREYLRTVRVMALVVMAAAVRDGFAADRSADEILRGAEQHRGLLKAHMFRARIVPEADDDRGSGAVDSRPPATLVEVRSNGFAQQLVVVLEPNRGDVMLSTPDVVWLRPRRLHRLTRIPPDLRMFNGASVADVTSIDLVGTYAATLNEEIDGPPGQYRMDLAATREGARYPRAVYLVRREDLTPIQIDFMAASGKVLKTLMYGEFRPVLGRIIPTQLIVRDHVYRDSSIVRMSDFQVLSPLDPAMFEPDYLLTIPDPT